MLIDKFLPDYQVQSFHSLAIAAPPNRVFEALKTTDLSRSLLIRVLTGLRGMRGHGDGSAGRMLGSGFVPLAENPPEEIVIGLIGKFWTPSGSLRNFQAEEFATLNPGDCAKAVFNFRTEPLDSSLTRLSTETRIWCPDETVRRRFLRYWTLIRPFSGLIRKEMLKQVRATAVDR